MSTRTTGPVRDDVQETPPVFPFFVGCGRSGTTLLRAIFDSHPEMHVPQDTYFILNLESNRRRYEARGGFDVEAFVADLARQFDFNRWPIGTDEIAADMRQRPPANYPDAIRQIFRLCARSQGKKRYGNKSPVHVRGMPELARLFPEARFVHIIRDGRNVARSYFEVDFGPSTIEGAALRWRRHVSTGRRDGARLGPSRYMEVRYEQILDDPEGTIRRLCLFLGIPFDERTLRYSERTEDIFIGRKPPKHHRHLALPPTKGLRDWRTEMSAADVATFESLAGGLLTELGYERGCPNPGLRVRLRAQSRLLVERLNRARRKLRRRSGPPPSAS